MKVWAEGKPGVNQVRQKLREYGLELCASDPEIVVVWGGDGSILRAARCYPDIPLLGLRVESIGHLAEVNGSRWKDAFERLRQRDFTIEEAFHIELIYNDFQIGL